LLPGAEDADAGNAAADHGYFVAAVKARAVLAVFENFVGQLGFVFYGAEAVFEKEVGDAGEEADRLDAVLLGFFDEGLEDVAAGALALGCGLNDDGAYFGEMRAVEMESAAT
jgi:hypothetical protein